MHRKLRRHEDGEQPEVLLGEECRDDQSESRDRAESIGSPRDRPEHDDEHHLAFEEARPPLVEVWGTVRREALGDTGIEHPGEHRGVDAGPDGVGEHRDSADTQRDGELTPGPAAHPAVNGKQQKRREHDHEPRGEPGIHVGPEQEEWRQSPDGRGPSFAPSTDDEEHDGNSEHRDHRAGNADDAVQHQPGDHHGKSEPGTGDARRSWDCERGEHHGRNRGEAHHQRCEGRAPGTHEACERDLIQPLLADPRVDSGKEAEGLVRRDPTGGDEPPQCEVPPDVGVAERLNGEHQNHRGGAADPCDQSRRRPALLLGARDHEQILAFHWFCAPAFGVALDCSAQTLPGAQTGTAGRRKVETLSVGTNATLRPSW